MPPTGATPPPYDRLMGTGPAAPLAEAAAALDGGDWPAARSGFEAALAVEDTAEAHAGLGEALWWIGELGAAIDHRQQAYARFRRRGETDRAFAQALLVILDYQGHLGNYAAAAGWLGRARGLVEESGLDELRGWLALAESNQDVDPVDGERLAREALRAGREHSDVDLELCALANLGACLVAQGHTEEGIAALDEAMAGSLAGEVESLSVVAFTSCTMMVSCIGCADLERAVRWAQAAQRFTERYGCPFVHAECRSTYGNVLLATGEWSRAEEELRTAIASAQGVVPVYHAQAVATLAELRLAQGRLVEARRLVSGVEDHPWAVPVLARLHLLAGRADAAESVLVRRLRAESTGWLERSVLLELSGEVALARDQPGVAAELGDEVLERGRALGCEVIVLRGRRLRGRALLAGGDLDGRVDLEAAAGGFASRQLVHEEALTHLSLAEHLADPDPTGAELEAREALAILERIGATGHADRAAALLRGLGAHDGRTGHRSAGLLSAREEQVLALLAEGLSNPEIARRLYISRKTVEHHVRHVTEKLGVRNRAEAAAEAVRRRPEGSTRE